MIRTFGDMAGKANDETGYTALICHSADIQSQWTPMDHEWRIVCAEFGVTALHMTDLMCKVPRGQYKEWGELKKAAFLTRLMDTFPSGGNQIKGCGCAVSLSGYRKAAKKVELPPIEKILAVLSIDCVGREFPDSDLSFVFDRGEKVRHFADQIWKRAGRPSTDRRPIMGRVKEIDAADVESSPGLQSTDMVAWLSRTHWVRTPSKFPGDDLRKMASPEIGRVHYYQSQRLEEQDLLNLPTYFDQLTEKL